MKQKLKDIPLDNLMGICKKYTLRDEKTKDKYCSAKCPFYITAVESKCTTYYMGTHPDEEVEISEE